MNRLGNLDNLNLGMGLTAKPSQFISADSASFQGIDFDSLNYKNVAAGLAILAVIIILLKFR